MLEPIRQYALERLEGSGEAEKARRRQAEFFLELAERAAPELTRAAQTEWLGRLAREHDNLRGVVSWRGGEDGGGAGGDAGGADGMVGAIGARARQSAGRALVAAGAEGRRRRRSPRLGSGVVLVHPRTPCRGHTLDGTHAGTRGSADACRPGEGPDRRRRAG